MQIYIDMFKQFCLKYKRYFGALILFIVFVVVLSKCAGPEDRQKNTEQNTQSQAGEPESQTEIPVLEGALEKNAKYPYYGLLFGLCKCRFGDAGDACFTDYR